MKRYYKMTQVPKKLANAPSKNGNLSGLGRSNAPTYRLARKAVKRSVRPPKPPSPKKKPAPK